MAEDITGIEVFDFPEDLTDSELVTHFAEVHGAHTITPIAETWSEKDSCFILSFTAAEAQRILEEPEQLLDEDDPDSMIKLRPQKSVEPTRELLVVGENRMNSRMIKNYFKKRGTVEGVRELGDDKMKFVVKFADAEDAKKVADFKSMKINGEQAVSVELLQPIEEEVFVEPIQELLVVGENRMNSRMIKSFFKKHGAVEGVRELGNDKMKFVVKFADAEVANRFATEDVVELSKRDKVKVSLYTEDAEMDVIDTTANRGLAPYDNHNLQSSTSGAGSPFRPITSPSGTPSVFPSHLQPTHVEIDKLPSEKNTANMYELLNLHLSELFEDQFIPTKLSQSYDFTKDIFRYDLHAEEINTLLSSKQTLFEGEDNSTLTIRPSNTGRLLVVNVVDNPDTVELSRMYLHKCFGLTSKFCSTLNITQFTSTGAELLLETYSVASLIVSQGQHKLDNNIVVEASFSTSTDVAEDVDLPATPTSNVVLMKTALPYSIVRKLIKTRLRGALINNLGDGKYLVEYGSSQAAESVANQKVIKYSDREINVSLYSFDVGHSPRHTHIEVRKHPATSPRDMHMLLELHFCEVLGHEQFPSFDRSYDESESVFRFDLSQADISKLIAEPQRLELENDPQYMLEMTPACTGDIVVIHFTKSRPRDANRLVQLAFQHFSSNVQVVSHGKKMKVKLNSCSAAANIVSLAEHKLSNGSVVRAAFPDSVSSDVEDSDSSEEETGDDQPISQPPARHLKVARRITPDVEMLSEEVQGGDKTLLLSDLVDADEETIFYWLKARYGVWASRIQLSVERESAIVKIPANCHIDKNLKDPVNGGDYHLNRTKVEMKEVSHSRQVQITCSSNRPGDIIDKEALESYFSNGRYTGVKDVHSFKSIEFKMNYNKLPVFVAEFSSAQDVYSVLNHQPYKLSKWTFDVIEYYCEVGVCDPQMAYTCPTNHQATSRGKSDQTPILYIKNMDNDTEFEMLQLLLAHKRRSGGGEISSWTVLPNDEGKSDVRIVYKEPAVAEQVFASQQNERLIFKGRSLQLELELPWLSDVHDVQKIRISGINDELEPEKLRFYLSTLSDNVVTELFFNEQQTRAIALFRNKIDYPELLEQSRTVPLKDFPQLRIQQDYKESNLVATGDFDKDDLELTLESLAAAKCGRDVRVNIERFAGEMDKWRITADHEALSYIMEKKDRITRIKTIDRYSDFLGLRVTGGAHRKTHRMSDLGLDELLVQFLIAAPAGKEQFVDFLTSQGFELSDDGLISASQSSSGARASLKSLTSSIERFVDDHFLCYRTSGLSQKVFDLARPEIVELLQGKPVASNVSHGDDERTRVAIVGEIAQVESIKLRLEAVLSSLENRLAEEAAIVEQVVPNIFEYQFDYLELVGFYTKMINEHRLASFQGNPANRTIRICGNARALDTVQTVMIELLHRVDKSKKGMYKKPEFLEVFCSHQGEQLVKGTLKSKKIAAVWCKEEQTIFVYSESVETSLAAIRCIEELMWDSLYPLERDLDDLETQQLSVDTWKAKRVELQKLYNPLAISQLENQPRLCVAGLSKDKEDVISDIAKFFDYNIIRHSVFTGVPNRITFLQKFDESFFEKLGRQFDVEVKEVSAVRGIELMGTKVNLVSLEQRLQNEHDSICRVIQPIEQQAMVRHIKEDPDFLEDLCRKTSCLVVPHQEEVIAKPNVYNSGKIASSPKTRYTVTLNTQVTCEVRQGDITAMTCDAIVNAANGRLQHAGGLARAIIKRGGYGIQEECAEYIEKNGRLATGQAYTSGAGRLNCKKVVHAVGPKWINGQSGETKALATCVRSCFEEAEKYQLQSIALPPISTGIFGFPLALAVKTIVGVVEERETKELFLPNQIIFMDNKSDSLVVFEEELQKRYGRTSPQPTDHQFTADNPNVKVTGRNICIMDRVNLEIKVGDLTTSTEDSLVNSVGNDFKLDHGKVAISLAARAGGQLQRACDAYGQINIGEVKETDGFSLGCKKILHCNCPSYAGSQTVQMLKNIVFDCLVMASNNQHKSIAFPALGTGNLSFHERIVAKAMIEAVMEYVEKASDSSIKDVKIVIFYGDVHIRKAFDDELRNLEGSEAGAKSARDLLPIDVLAKRSVEASSIPEPVLKATLTGGVKSNALKGCVTVNNTAIRIVEGDITNHRADVLVNSTDHLLSIRGQVSRAMVRKAGQDVKDEIAALSRSGPKEGMWVSKAGQLNADYIFHVDVSAHDNWSTMIQNCLKECDRQHFHTIAFPAIGTGVLSKPAKEMARLILQAIVTYLNDHQSSTLTSIDMVIYQPGMVQDFVSSMQKAVEKKEPWLARLAAHMSKWMSVDSYPDIERELAPVVSQQDVSIFKLDIYGANEAHIDDCKVKLQHKFGKKITKMSWKDKPSYREDRWNIAKLTTTQVRRLLKEADSLSVTLDVDQQRSNVTIEGLSNDVYRMSEMVSNELRNVENEANERKEEKLIARAVQWMYEEDDDKWLPFHPYINKAIEETYQRQPEGVHAYMTRQGRVKLDFRKMEGMDAFSDRFKIRRDDHSKEPETLVEVPKFWNSPIAEYSEHTLLPSSAEYRQVEHNFQKTIRHQDYPAHGIPSGAEVLEVRRVQNPTLYQQYVVLRQQTAAKLNKTEDEVEMVPLWHGTSAETVSKITSGQFDRGLAGKNATVYGRGSYFCVYSWYSAQDLYSRPDAQNCKYMIQARAITGEWCRGSRKFEVAPYKDEAKTIQYDSVVNDMDKPAIFVVFNDASAYPEYIIKFKALK